MSSQPVAPITGTLPSSPSPSSVSRAGIGRGLGLVLSGDTPKGVSETPSSASSSAHRRRHLHHPRHRHRRCRRPSRHRWHRRPSAGITSAGSSAQTGPEPQLGGLADHLEGPLLILDAWELDDDAVALAGDVGFGHTQTVDAVADDVDRGIQRLVERFAAQLGVIVGLEDDLGPSLEIETEQHAVSLRRATR